MTNNNILIKNIRYFAMSLLVTNIMQNNKYMPPRMPTIMSTYLRIISSYTFTMLIAIIPLQS